MTTKEDYVRDIFCKETRLLTEDIVTELFPLRTKVHININRYVSNNIDVIFEILDVCNKLNMFLPEVAKIKEIDFIIGEEVLNNDSLILDLLQLKAFIKVLASNNPGLYYALSLRTYIYANRPDIVEKYKLFL